MSKYKPGQVWQNKEYELNICVIEEDLDQCQILLRGNPNKIYKTWFGRTHRLLTDQKDIEELLHKCYEKDKFIPGFESFFDLMQEKEMQVLATQIKDHYLKGLNGLIEIINLSRCQKRIYISKLAKYLDLDIPIKENAEFKDYRDVAYEKVRARLERNPTLYSVNIGVKRRQIEFEKEKS
jgi:hypothetical protein